jgi:hypothetical protein
MMDAADQSACMQQHIIDHLLSARFPLSCSSWHAARLLFACCSPAARLLFACCSPAARLLLACCSPAARLLLACMQQCC